jgi:hypothetical protein
MPSRDPVIEVITLADIDRVAVAIPGIDAGDLLGHREPERRVGHVPWLAIHGLPERRLDVEWPCRQGRLLVVHRRSTYQADLK